MAGGSMRHNALCIRLGRVLDTQLQGRCVVMSSDQHAVAANRLDIDAIFAGMFELLGDE